MKTFEIIKASGEREPFSYEKYSTSLKNAGADAKAIKNIIDKMEPFFKSGISTKELYAKTYELLKKDDHICASRYSLKEALRLLGPSGFPFEFLVGELLKSLGYKVKIGVEIPGKCVEHEIDVLGSKDKKYILVECKFHNRPGLKSSVQTPLYVKARFDDIGARTHTYPVHHGNIEACFVITNTKFTSQAIKYGECVGIKMVAWAHPKNNGLEIRIQKEGLYPITALTTIKEHERKQLLKDGIVLCRQIEKKPLILQKIGIDKERQTRIIKECNSLCA